MKAGKSNRVGRTKAAATAKKTVRAGQGPGRRGLKAAKVAAVKQAAAKKAPARKVPVKAKGRSAAARRGR